LIKKRLTEIQKKIKEGNISLEDIAEITSESFLSQSKHFYELSEALNNIASILNNILQNIEKITTPVFQVIEEDEEETE
jgi:hypothetical protein